MTIGYGPVGSVLNEQPPSGGYPSILRDSPHGHVDDGLLVTAAPPDQSLRESGGHKLESGGHKLEGFPEYDVVYDDADGYPLLAFSGGQWFDVTSISPRPVSVRFALRRDSSWAGAVVQTICLWMRSNPNHERSFDLATELALAVGEMARQPR
ncbi:MAG TPA: hypothetical protein VFQ15_08425 [Jiangellaceae bacterium]|nr:hypothetical protein [Jiangellaceae bacterium]